MSDYATAKGTPVKRVREYRVWLETGDFVAGAEVHKCNGWFTVLGTPFSHYEKPRKQGFRSEDDAFAFAKELAKDYLSDAIREDVESRGTPEAEAEAAYSLQVVEDGRTV